MSLNLGTDQPQPTALQKQRKQFVAQKREDVVDKISELKDKAKNFQREKTGKVKTRFTKQSGEKY